MKNKRAFTLAETLVALALVGAVIATTMIIFQQTTWKSNFAEQLKATYNQFTQAFIIILQNNRGDLTNTMPNSNSMMQTFCNVMKCTRTCSAGQTPGNCFTSDAGIKALTGAAPVSVYDDKAGAILANGVHAEFFTDGIGECFYQDLRENGVNSRCGCVRVDLNGFKGPNTIGRDIFIFCMSKHKFVPHGGVGTWNPSFPAGYWTPYTHCDTSDATGYSGDTCASRVLQENGMNY